MLCQKLPAHKTWCFQNDLESNQQDIQCPVLAGASLRNTVMMKLHTDNIVSLVGAGIAQSV